MHILVTGTTGFLGKHLGSYLSRLGHQVTGASTKNCDLTKRESLEQFNSEKFDQIYHLAAWTQAGDFCLRHPADQWVINQQINTNVLDWWMKKQPQAKLICMGTSCSYDPEERLIEENYLKGTPISSLYTYAMTKRMLLVGLMAIQKQYGLEYLYAIPSTLYGANYHSDERQMHFIFDLIRKILKGRFAGDRVVLWGNGEQKRELIHVEDFIQALYTLAATERNTWINIGGGAEYSIREFAQKICQIVGYPNEKIEYDLTRYVGAKSKVLNIEKLQKLIPSFSPRPLEKGLHEVIEWFQSPLEPNRPRFSPCNRNESNSFQIPG